MIKRIRELNPEALIASKKFRDYAEKFESEIVRGIGKLVVLSVIRQFKDTGAYGYKILKVLQEETHDTLVIDEGTLYPLLRNLKRDKLLRSEEKIVKGRRRNYYIITKEGEQIFNHMAGVYTKMTEAIMPLFDVVVNLSHDKFYYCPMCANKIDIEENERFCSVCGYNVYEELKNRREK